ncbi:MAG TPA: hypothetical protein VF021_11640 [Longimicrobiales bacterium]
MWKIEYDLSCLTCEELIEARAKIQHALERKTAHGQDQGYITEDEKHLIAQALDIDEATGEWRSGA